MRRLSQMLTTAALLFFALAGPLPAQIALTLEDALEHARQHNPAYRQALNNLELNTYELHQAWLSLLPSMSLTMLQTGLHWRRTTVAEDFFGRPLENPETRMLHTTNSNQGGRLTLGLDFRQFLQLRQLRTAADARHDAARAQWQAVHAGVVNAFLDAQQHELSLELEQQLLKSARLTEEEARQLFVLARADRTDLLGAEVDVAAQEAAVEQAVAARRTALLALRHLIGDSALVEFTIVPVRVQLFDPATLDEEALVRRALRASPQILQQVSSLETQRRAKSIQRAEWLPTLSLQVGAGRQRFVQGGGAFFDVNPGTEWDSNMSLSLTFPDPGQYFSRRNTAGQTDVAIRNQEEILRQLRGQVEQDVRRLLIELRASHRDIALQERRAGIADERARLMHEQYGLGRGSFADLQSAANAAAAARRQALQARFGFERARLDLEAVLGGPLDPPGNGAGGSG